MFRKEIIITMIVIILSFNLSFSQEKLGQIIGSFEKTNEKVSINKVLLDVYKIKGKDAIIVEELGFCGYDISWDSKTRTTTLTKNDKKNINKNEYVSMNNNLKGNVYSSDIKIYIKDSGEMKEIPSYNIGGYSIVNLEDLKNIREYIDIVKLKEINGSIYLPKKEIAPAGGIDVSIQTYYCFPPHVSLIDEVKVHISEGKNSAKYSIKGNNDYENIIYFSVVNTDKYYNSHEKDFYHSKTYEIMPDPNAVSVGNNTKQDILILKKSKLTGVINLPENLDKNHISAYRDTREFRISALYKDKCTSITLKNSLDDKNIPFELDIPQSLNDGKFNLQIQGTMYEGFSQRHYMGGPIMTDSYYSNGNLVNDINSAQILNVKDLDNIKVNVNIDKPIGKEIGKVYWLNEKLNGQDIRIFDIRGNLGIKVSDLKKLGYKTSFNNLTKQLHIKSDASNPSFKEVLEVEDKNFGNSVALYTDINTYLNNKEIDSFNIDGSIVVLFKDLEIAIDLSENIVKFEDVSLEKEIRKIINKSEGSIYLLDLINDDLRILNLAGKNINSLKGIEHLLNVEILNLNDNNIDDISYLSSMKNLYSLNLDNNNIKDMSPLKNLIKLRDLKMKRNSIKDIPVFQNLSELGSIDLSENHIKDVRGISYLINLYDIDLSNNEIEDISSLATLREARRLALNCNKIKDISSIGTMNNIDRLELSNNQIEDISPLKSLTKLARLDLGFNSIKDISPIKDMEYLYELTINNNKITNIEVLYNIKYLYKLHLAGNEIKDYAPINSYYNNLKDKDF